MAYNTARFGTVAAIFNQVPTPNLYFDVRDRIAVPQEHCKMQGSVFSFDYAMHPDGYAWHRNVALDCLHGHLP